MSEQKFIVAMLIDGEHRYTGRIPLEIIEDPSGFVAEPGHIKAELDFIPVEERLPEDAFDKLAIVSNDHGGHEIGTYHLDLDAPIEWVWGDEEPIGIGWRVTHWAEIPEIET